MRLAGLPVLAAQANTDLSHSRWWLPLAGLAAVGIVLTAIYRSARRALVPLIPVLMATGWSGLVVAALGVSLNPMSATLGALVIAIATEFSVILSARYANERRAGLSVGRGPEAHLPPHRRRRPRLGRHRDRGLRRPGDRRAAAAR